MNKIAIITDTNSSMTPEEAKELGIFLLQMPFIVDGREYSGEDECSYEHFFEMLANGADVSTSQPAPAVLTSYWDNILKEYDEIVHIPMSSALSGSCATAKALASGYDGRVCVADNKRISISQRSSVLDAKRLSESGLNGSQIVERLEASSYDSSIYLAVNTLELLKKSGRVTSAGATLATVLNLKPVLQIQGEKLDAFAKARGMESAKSVMLKAIEQDLENRFKGKNVTVECAYSGDVTAALQWKSQVEQRFSQFGEIALRKLPISISCHVGAGVLAIGCLQHLD